MKIKKRRNHACIEIFNYGQGHLHGTGTRRPPPPPKCYDSSPKTVTHSSSPRLTADADKVCWRSLRHAIKSLATVIRTVILSRCFENRLEQRSSSRKKQYTASLQHSAYSKMQNEKKGTTYMFSVFRDTAWSENKGQSSFAKRRLRSALRILLSCHVMIDILCLIETESAIRSAYPENPTWNQT